MGNIIYDINDKLSYVGPKRQDNNYKFDRQLYNEMLSKRQYEDAANYASSFRFKNPTDELAHKAGIERLRMLGKREQGLYNSVSGNDDEKARIDFADKIFLPDAGNALDNSENPYYKDYIRMLDKLGSELNIDGSISKQATGLAIRFLPEKQSLLGIDWLKRDNPNNIDNFYKRTGYTPQYLEQQGVKIMNDKDGSTVLMFDKTNKETKSLLHHINDNHINDRQYGFWGKVNSALKPVEGILSGVGLDSRGVGFNDDPNLPVIIQGYRYNDNGEQEFLNMNTQSDGILENIYAGFNKTETGRLNSMHDLIEECQNIKESYYENATKIERSSISTGYLSNDLRALEEQYLNGNIKSSDYNTLKKATLSNYDSEFANFVHNISQYEIYSNYETEGETVYNIDDLKQKKKIADMLMYAWQKGYVTPVTTLTGTQYATDLLVSFPPSDEDGIDMAGDRQKINVRVPKLFESAAQQNAYKDTSFRAVAQLNDMESYNYDYTLIDGNKVKPVYQKAIGVDGKTYNIDAQWKLGDDDRLYSREEILNIMKKDMGIKDTRDRMIASYINARGAITDYEAYKNEIKRWAIRIANECNPSLYKPLTEEEVFSAAKVETYDNDNIPNKYTPTIDQLRYNNADRYKAILDAIDIYTRVYNELITYNYENR